MCFSIFHNFITKNFICFNVKEKKLLLLHVFEAREIESFFLFVSAMSQLQQQLSYSTTKKEV